MLNLDSSHPIAIDDINAKFSGLTANSKKELVHIYRYVGEILESLDKELNLMRREEPDFLLYSETKKSFIKLLTSLNSEEVNDTEQMANQEIITTWCTFIQICKEDVQRAKRALHYFNKGLKTHPEAFVKDKKIIQVNKSSLIETDSIQSAEKAINNYLVTTCQIVIEANQVFDRIKEHDLDQQKVNREELAITGTIGCFFGTLIAGTPGSVIGAVVAPAAYLKAKKINHSLFQKKLEGQVLCKPVFDPHQKVVYEFDRQSSGYIGYYVKSQSWTIGNVYIKINKKITLTVRFDLNAKEKINYNELFNGLQIYLEKNELKPKNFSTIINQLKTIPIERSSSSKLYLIEEDSTYFDALFKGPEPKP